VALFAIQCGAGKILAAQFQAEYDHRFPRNQSRSSSGISSLVSCVTAPTPNRTPTATE